MPCKRFVRQFSRIDRVKPLPLPIPHPLIHTIPATSSTSLHQVAKNLIYFQLIKIILSLVVGVVLEAPTEQSI